MDGFDGVQPPCSMTGHEQLSLSVWYCQHWQRWRASWFWLSDTSSPEQWSTCEKRIDFGPFDTWQDVSTWLLEAMESMALPAGPGSERGAPPD